MIEINNINKLNKKNLIMIFNMFFHFRVLMIQKINIKI